MLAALGQLASSLINARTAKINTDKTNQANRELAEYSYEKDTEAWNRQNEYNLPTAQMARLKAAGLNPNLVYGNGAAQSTAATMPKYNAPTMQYNYRPAVDPLAMIGAYQDFQIRQAQTNNLRAQYNNTMEETRGKKLLNDVLDNTKEARVWERIYNINYAKERYDRSGWQTKREELDYKFRKNTLNDYQAEGMSLRNQLIQKEIDFFDWSKFTDILTRFGVKLPSFRK